MNGVQPVAVIQIFLMPDGQMQCNAQVPNRYTMNAMMETAKQNFLAQLIEAEKNPNKVVVPPPMPGVDLRNRG